jgi:hypothetical protein
MGGGLLGGQTSDLVASTPSILNMKGVLARKTVRRLHMDSGWQLFGLY